MRTHTGNIPPLVAEVLGDLAVRQHAESFLTRGGGVGRAQSELRKGLPIADAARIAAKQAKGHGAEIRQAAELTTEAGWTYQPYRGRPNKVANDPHIDVEVVRGHQRVNGAQLGVGSPKYLARKARLSKAPQVVVNSEAREELDALDPVAFARTADRLAHDGTRARVLRGKQVEEETRQSLERSLRGETAVGTSVKFGRAAGAGANSFVLNFGKGMLFEVVEALALGRKIDPDRVKRILADSGESAVRTALQTYATVEHYLSQAGAAYQGKLLHAASRRAVWIGAVVDVIVSTAKDVVRWFHGEITFEDVLRRAGVSVCAAGGGAMAAVLAAQVCRGLPPWLLIPLVLLAGWGGTKLGSKAGEALFLPGPMTGPEPSTT